MAAAGEGAGKGKRKRVGPVEIWRCASLTDDDAAAAAKCARTRAPDQPVHRARRSANVSDDVADIANCKNYHRETSPAASDFLTRAKPSPALEFDTIADNLDVSFNARSQRPAMFAVGVDVATDVALAGA